jgi:hypothetical protein
MKLPNPELTIIDLKKLSDYCLNPEHPDGQHKARVFKAALGISLENVEELRLALLEAIRVNEAVIDKSNQYGQKYVIDFTMARAKQQATIHSVWIVKYTEDFARLVTCYIL